jgi:methylmalonyl-CoA/ethylmalonyl-CoA epimerase
LIGRTRRDLVRLSYSQQSGHRAAVQFRSRRRKMAHILHHVGIVVNNLEEAIGLYNRIPGFVPRDKDIKKSPKRGLQQVHFFIGNNFIELIQPIETGDGSKNRFAEFLKKRGEGLFHLAIFTDEFDKDVRALKEKGFAVEETEAKDLYPGYTIRLAFLRPEETRGVWIEYVDSASHPTGGADFGKVPAR